MLHDKDRIFTNLYGEDDWSTWRRAARGDWDGTKDAAPEGPRVDRRAGQGLGPARARRRRLSDRPQVVVHAQGERRPAAYLVVNADESEPGTCKDREIMRHDPHKLVEGCLIAGFAMGAPPATSTSAASSSARPRPWNAAIAEAYDAGLLGKNACGSGYDYDIYVHRGAGAYICGEETALLEASRARRASRG
jgi:NADH-quinone oxidoreductase subunit F